ncbi:Protein of unknown function [Pyronema omphalodes CBS 100304]|uniref:Uncharacterized protein n=1 Tax=Pyronema omphalodes (strain CBS 100304) TaxID=1076935 RepID=U4LBU4_PYROM|nr:Protein of unknown function [Pyronema omphalodes CBS 100304]
MKFISALLTLCILLLSSTTAVSATPVPEPLPSPLPPSGVTVAPNDAPRIQLTKVELYTYWNFQGAKMIREFEKMDDSGCQTLRKEFRRLTMSYKVSNGCCTFFEDDSCAAKMFTAKSREDG